MGFTTMRELHAAGLLDFSSDVPQLTDKGRDSLRALEDQTKEDAELEGSAGDLVLSTSGLFR